MINKTALSKIRLIETDEKFPFVVVDVSGLNTLEKISLGLFGDETCFRLYKIKNKIVAAHIFMQNGGYNFIDLQTISDDIRKDEYSLLFYNTRKLLIESLSESIESFGAVSTERISVDENENQKRKIKMGFQANEEG